MYHKVTVFAETRLPPKMQLLYLQTLASYNMYYWTLEFVYPVLFQCTNYKKLVCAKHALIPHKKYTPANNITVSLRYVP